MTSRQFLDGLEKTIERYDELWEIQDPEENPYKSKYVARELLELSVKDLEQLLASEESVEQRQQGSDVLARLFLFLGKNLYFCEEVPGAEKYFIRALERLLRSPLRREPEAFCFLQASELLASS